MQAHISRGSCLYCQETLDQKELKAHLNNHVKSFKENIASIDKQSFLIKVTGMYKDDPHFLYLLLNGDTDFNTLDYFLRGIWLECCGHMSSFTLDKKDIPKVNLEKYLDPPDDEDEDEDDNDFWGSSDFSPGEIPFNVPVKEVLAKGRKISHTYDYGSTTTLYIFTEYVYNFEQNEPILLLSRNLDLEHKCDVCNEPAFLICNFHNFEEDDMFCINCAKIHKKECSDFEEIEMPIVNSPRMGVCAYTGGNIDLERDGPWKGNYEYEEE